MVMCFRKDEALVSPKSSPKITFLLVGISIQAKLPASKDLVRTGVAILFVSWNLVRGLLIIFFPIRRAVFVPRLLYHLRIQTKLDSQLLFQNSPSVIELMRSGEIIERNMKYLLQVLKQRYLDEGSCISDMSISLPHHPVKPPNLIFNSHPIN